MSNARTRERLRALHAEAGSRQADFEKRRTRRTCLCMTANITMATGALGSAVTSFARMPAEATLIFGVTGALAIGFHLFLSTKQDDSDLQALANAWAQHRGKALQLIRASKKATVDEQTIRHFTDTLECAVIDTRIKSMLHKRRARHQQHE